jgi:hypothetical protein
MDRRFFLKAVAALSAVPLIKVPDFRVIEPEAIVLPGEDWFANIREQSAFSIGHNATIYRWDLWDGRQQWGVGFIVRSPEQLTKARNGATVVLRDTLRHEGIDLRSLRPIPEAGWTRVS